ncbi:MAG: ArnT family glycosyltransferase [Methanosarcinales archaeon]
MLKNKGLKKFLEDKYNIFFLIILIIAAFLRFRYLLIDSVWPDEALYIWNALKLAQSPLFLFSSEMADFVSYIPVIIIAFFIPIGKVVAGRITSVLFSLVGIIGIYFLGKELKDKLTGLLGAMFLAATPLFYFFSNRILIDVPLTSMFIVSMLCILKFEKYNNKKWGILTGLSIGLTMYIKASGTLMLLIAIVYFAYSYRKNLINLFKEKSFQYGFSILLILTIILFINNFIHFGNFFSSSYTGALEGEIFVKGGYEFHFLQIPYSLSWFILPFIIVGLFFMMRDWKINKNVLILLWIAVIFLFFTFIVREKVPRYTMPAYPALLLIVGYGMSKLKFKNSKVIWIIVGLVITITMYQTGSQLIELQSLTHSGFEEAGESLKGVADNAIIYAGSIRQIRTFSGYDYAENGGNIYSLPKTKNEFEYILRNATKKVYIEIDTWEIKQPNWIYPITKNKLDYFLSLGFEVHKIVERDLIIKGEIIKLPVIFLLKK